MITHRIRFIGGNSERIKTTFYGVLSSFKPLESNQIILKKRQLKNTTMQAQPCIDMNFFCRRTRNYVIHISPHSRIEPEMKTNEMPESVLKGWFAHELGHLMDYHTRPWYEIVWLGLGYLVSRRVRMTMERTADIYALEHGFGQDILATKNFILNHANVSPSYKAQINRYYLSPAEIEKLLIEHEAGKTADEEIKNL